MIQSYDIDWRVLAMWEETTPCVNVKTGAVASSVPTGRRLWLFRCRCGQWAELFSNFCGHCGKDWR